MEIVLAILLGPILWLAGAIVFDVVHWLLHAMLRSRWAWLRVLAWPHEVHHRWIDRALDTHWELQTANVWCHLVPEFLTQLVFTGVLALVLPWPFVGVVLALQVAVFVGLLRARGRDINHRPVARIDAHPAGWRTPPSYHLLHHAFPDAYFSAYTKLVDRIVGGGAQIAGRRFAWRGPGSPLAAALRSEVESAGGATVDGPDDFADIDVLVLADPRADLLGPVEAFIAATRDRQLPPEVWAVRADPADALARHYRDDVRVAFRTLWLPEDAAVDEAWRRRARRALFWVRRDAHFVPLSRGAPLAALRRFLSTPATAPPGAALVRHRLELVAPE